MEESQLHETIRKEFNISSFNFKHPTFTLRPAWKHAYYNAAKRDGNGKVIVRESKFLTYVFTPIIALITILSLAKGDYAIGAAGVVMISGFILSAKYLTGKMLVFDKEGISVLNKLYKWEDYDGAYIATLIDGRQRYAKLVLVRNDKPAVYIDITGFMDLSTVGTPIRDFQPQIYKEKL